MAIGLGTTALVTGIANSVGSIGGTILNQYNADKTREFNREEAEKNRQFQREMAQNNIKYAVNQAKELGISPSLVLGDQTTSLGGSQASVGNPPSNNNFSGLGQLASVLQDQIRTNANREMNEDRLKTMREINHDRLETMKEITKMRMGNTAMKQDYMNHNYTKEQLNSLIDDLDNIEI